MSVEVRTVHTGKLHLAVHREAAAAAHSCAVDHNGVHTHGGGNVVLFCKFTGKLHHQQRTDGKNAVKFYAAVNQLLQLSGDKAVIAISAVVRADMQVSAGLPHLFFQNDNILGLEASD